nr:glycosyltransferase [Bacteroidales bacterium]
SQSGDREVSYLWPFLSMRICTDLLEDLGEMDDKYSDIRTALTAYYNPTKNGLRGFDSYPVNKGGGTRFYDDNSIVGLAYLEAYNLRGDGSDLDMAKMCSEFTMDGETDHCEGGLLWNEDEKDLNSANYNKAMCATGYATNLALRLYQTTNDIKYYNYGKRLYVWLKDKMQDPEDLLYWNDRRIADCEVNTTKWTYNTGIMISNEVLLYEIENDQLYLTSAIETARATYDRFTSIVGSNRFFPDHDPWFNVELFKAYLDLEEYDDNSTLYIETLIKSGEYAWDNARNDYGLFYEDWTGVAPKRDYSLLNQACVVEFYARVAMREFIMNNQEK